MSNAALIATGNFEIVGPAVECRTCRGSGIVADTQALSIGRGIRAINRKCRPCEGTGEILPLEPIAQYLLPQEIGDIPEWMLGV